MQGGAAGVVPAVQKLILVRPKKQVKRLLHSSTRCQDRLLFTAKGFLSLRYIRECSLDLMTHL